MSKELRYYTPLFMGFVLDLIGIFAPPIGQISKEVIYATGCFLLLCATVVGLDVPATLREIRLIKNNVIEDITKDVENEKNK